MGILFTILMGILFTITIGILFTIVLGIQFTISKGKLNHRKNRMCCPILIKKIEVEEEK